MNISITKEQILNGLQAVQNVVSTRTTLPIISKKTNQKTRTTRNP